MKFEAQQAKVVTAKGWCVFTAVCFLVLSSDAAHYCSFNVARITGILTQA